MENMNTQTDKEKREETRSKFLAKVFALGLSVFLALGLFGLGLQTKVKVFLES